MLVRRARTRSSWLRYAHLNLSPCYCLQLSPAANCSELDVYRCVCVCVSSEI
jgi:hypothetical protein